MLSDHRGYIIEADRNHAHAWKGEKTDRMPDVIAHDLSDAMYKINRLVEYDESVQRLAAELVTPI